MGYDLHITRKDNWSDEAGPVIDEAEWRRIIDEDGELSLDMDSQSQVSDGQWVFAAWKGEQGVLWWRAGEIVSKNPDELLIAKMVQIAGRLGATVQGDDGEIYREDGSYVQPRSSLPPPRHGVTTRIASWLQHRRTTRELQEAAPQFRVGDRVRDSFGRPGTVVNVDRRASHGLGNVRVRFDDGRELSLAIIASGLEIVVDPEKHDW
jgi:hypothetical protein